MLCSDHSMYVVYTYIVVYFYIYLHVANILRDLQIDLPPHTHAHDEQTKKDFVANTEREGTTHFRVRVCRTSNTPNPREREKKEKSNGENCTVDMACVSFLLLFFFFKFLSAVPRKRLTQENVNFIISDGFARFFSACRLFSLLLTFFLVHIISCANSRASDKAIPVTVVRWKWTRLDNNVIFWLHSRSMYKILRRTAYAIRERHANDCHFGASSVHCPARRNPG